MNKLPPDPFYCFRSVPNLLECCQFQEQRNEKVMRDLCDKAEKIVNAHQEANQNLQQAWANEVEKTKNRHEDLRNKIRKV